MRGAAFGREVGGFATRFLSREPLRNAVRGADMA
jgi:hypothetical protein